MTKSIVLTGGGTAGHVTPNMALIPLLQQQGWTINYIGAVDGVEKEMIRKINIPYHAIRCGKLRRYFSWQNFIDPFNIMVGIIQSYRLIKRLKTQVVFSKGGFVSLPVVVGAYLNRVPVIVHESDMTPGLANKLSFPFASLLCLSFAATQKYIKKAIKTEVTGTPIREALFHGDKDKGLAMCGFQADKPCLLVMGGSQGSALINQCVRAALDVLCERYQVIHLCGREKIDSQLLNRPDYYQLEYADQELPDLFAASDMVLTRSGANSLCEILALQKPHILVPLSFKVSRGDQIHNARYFSGLGISTVIDEEQLSTETLMDAITTVEQQRATVIDKMAALQMNSASERIVQLIAGISGL